MGTLEESYPVVEAQLRQFLLRGGRSFRGLDQLLGTCYLRLLIN